MNQIKDDRLTRTVQEVAALLGIGRNSVYELIYQKRLRGLRIGHKIVVPLSSIEEFLKGAD